MGFEVHITDEAFGDLDVIAGFIKYQAGINIARKWLAGIIATIWTLGQMLLCKPVGRAPAIVAIR